MNGLFGPILSVMQDLLQVRSISFGLMEQKARTLTC
jgi:hypothetical protein